jgi:hypothetical protein
MVPPRASELLSDQATRELLQQQLDADVDHVKATVAQTRLESALCCLGLLYTAEEEVAAVSHLYGWTQAARASAFNADTEAALWTLWGADWDIHYDDVVAPPALTETTRRLTQALLEAGCDEPAGAFLMDLAYRLNREVLPVATTPDFACWASEHEIDDEPWRWMTVVARPEVIDRFAANGWLRLPDDY